MPIKLNFGPLFEQLNNILGVFQAKMKNSKKKNYNRTTKGCAVA